MVAVPQDTDQLKEYRKEMEKAKRMILDGTQDHLVSHVASKDTTKEMWDALSELFHSSSE